MDPRKFDGMIRKLSGSLSRRSLVGGSLGASVLAAVGLSDDDALAKRKRVGAEACIPTGKKCPAKKPRGRRKKNLGCDKCCQGITVTVTNRKGNQVTKCSCKPLDSVCTPDKSHQCCSGVCGDGKCQFEPCAEIGQSCATLGCCSSTAQCSDANVCVTCLPTGDTGCGVNADCCSGNCQGTTCFACKTNLTTCDANAECCSGFCDIGGSNQCEAP